VTDHIIPRAQGGDNRPSNLQAACANCNGRKGSRVAA
jgi:5-methylcytosine-specific restriction endonuclease McrA